MRERSIYLRLLRDLEKAHEALDVVDRRVHSLLEAIDNDNAKKIIDSVKKDLEL